MAQQHLDEVIRLMNVGLPVSEQTITSVDLQEIYKLNLLQIQAIDASAVFDPEESYCPVSDVPDDVGVGVHYVSGKIYIVGSNPDPSGICASLFMFRLSVA